MKATRICSTDDCDRRSFSRGMCQRHYDQARNSGTLDQHPLTNRPRTECAVDDCDKLTHAQGLCAAHFSRWKRHGDVERGRVERTAMERFSAFVEKRPTGCWQWTGAVDSKGYGQFCESTERRRVLAHRWSYTHHVGPIPDGLTIDHLCRNTGCVNPDHLEPVTRDENLRREHAARAVR